MIDNLAIHKRLIRVARLVVGSPAQRAEYQVGHQVAEVQLPCDGHGVVAIDDELAAFDLECLRRMVLRGVQGAPVVDGVAVKVGPLSVAVDRPSPPIERRLLTMHDPVGGVLLAIEQQTTFGDERAVVSSIQVTRPAN